MAPSSNIKTQLNAAAPLQTFYYIQRYQRRFHIQTLCSEAAFRIFMPFKSVTNRNKTRNRKQRPKSLQIRQDIHTRPYPRGKEKGNGNKNVRRRDRR